jgi:propanol-preferring alcohol dehydrogenase
MKACLLRAPAEIRANPLVFTDLPVPKPGPGEVLVRVKACGVCRTDLHVIEGELPQRKSPVIPGHQIVGEIVAAGPNATRFPTGTRVGIPWLHSTDGSCEYCRSGAENLCDNPTFTGYTVDGGYAEFAVAPQDFVYAIPDEFPDEQAAPLLCAGIIGFRCLRLSGVSKGARIAFYGFGSAAHVAIQVARHWGIEVYAPTRGEKHQELVACNG